MAGAGSAPMGRAVRSAPMGRAVPMRHAFRAAVALCLAAVASCLAVPAPAAAAPETSTTAPPLGGTLFLDGLGATTAAGAPVPFTASLVNESPGPVVGLRTLISVALPGAGTREVRLDRRELDGSWAVVGTKIGTRGNVRFVDDSTTDRWMVPGAVVAGRYRLTFLSRGLSGDAVVVGEAQYRLGSGWWPLARSPQYLTRVIAEPAAGRGAAASGAAVPGAGTAAPYSPAPTLTVPAEPIVVEAPAAVGPAPGAGSPEAGPFASRWFAGVGIGVVAGLLAGAVWLLRREVVAGVPDGG